MSLTLALLVGVATAASPEPGLLAVATGHFVLAEQPAVYEPRLDAAVEKGMESLPFIIKPLARLRLKPAVYETVCPELSLALSGELLDLSCGGEQAPFSRRLDGSDGPIYDDGDPYQVTIAHGPSWVSIRFAGDAGGQANRYVFQPDGSMVLHATIFSKYLPDDLNWTLSYRRAKGPSSAGGS